MTDIGPFQDIIEVGWKIVPSLVVVRLLYTDPAAIDVIGSGLIGDASFNSAVISGEAVSDFSDGVIRFGQTAGETTFNGLPFGLTSASNVGSPGSHSFWIDMNAVRAGLADVPPVEDPENPGEFLDPVVVEEIAIDLYGLVTGQVDGFAIPVAIEVTVYGGRIAAPVERYLQPAFNDFTVVNPGGRLTGRTDTTLRQTMGNGYNPQSRGEFITQLILGTEIASIRFPADEIEDEE